MWSGATLLLIGLAILPGCTTITVDPASAGRSRRSIVAVGMTRVILPATRGRTLAADIRTLGAGWDAGPYLGWKSGSWIVADPAECQLIVIIRSDVEAANAARLLETLKGDGPCIADYTRRGQGQDRKSGRGGRAPR